MSIVIDVGICNSFTKELLNQFSFIATIGVQLTYHFVVLLGFCSRRVSAGASASGEYTYDTSLVTLHSYLGGRPLFTNTPFQFFHTVYLKDF